MAESDGVQILVTGDQNLVYQQSMVGREIAIVVLSGQDFAILQGHLEKIQAAIDEATAGSFEMVDCGAFTRS